MDSVKNENKENKNKNHVSAFTIKHVKLPVRSLLVPFPIFVPKGQKTEASAARHRRSGALTPAAVDSAEPFSEG